MSKKEVTPLGIRMAETDKYDIQYVVFMLEAICDHLKINKDGLKEKAIKDVKEKSK